MSKNNLFETYWKPVALVFVAFVVGGGAVTLLNNRSVDKEKKAQEVYFSAEKKMNEALYKNEDPTKPDAKKIDEKVSLGQAKEEFEKVMAQFPQSIAAQMSALHLAKMATQDKNFEQALSLLQKVESKDAGLINTLVQQQIGQILADQDKCVEAIGVWQKIVDKKEALFIHDEIKIQQALCYSKTNDFKKAEEILTNLANKVASPEMGLSTSSKEAEKYLRLLQFKKASGT